MYLMCFVLIMLYNVICKCDKWQLIFNIVTFICIKEQAFFYVPIFWRYYWTFFQFFFLRVVPNTFLSVTTSFNFFCFFFFCIPAILKIIYNKGSLLNQQNNYLVHRDHKLSRHVFNNNENRVCFYFLWIVYYTNKIITAFHTSSY